MPGLYGQRTSGKLPLLGTDGAFLPYEQRFGYSVHHMNLSSTLWNTLQIVLAAIYDFLPFWVHYGSLMGLCHRCYSAWVSVSGGVQVSCLEVQMPACCLVPFCLGLPASTCGTLGYRFLLGTCCLGSDACLPGWAGNTA